MSVDTIAGFGGVIFSAFIGFALYASDKDIRGMRVGAWVSSILAVSLLGFLSYPVTITCYWNSLDLGSRVVISVLDVLSVLVIIMFGLYFYYYFRHKGYLKQNIESIFPPDKPLID